MISLSLVQDQIKSKLGIDHVPWYVVLFVTLCIMFLYSQISFYVAYKRSGAKLAPFTGDRFLGFHILQKTLMLQKNHRFPDYVQSQFVEKKVWTMRFRVAGKPMISTIDPENIKAILATQFNEFALGTRHKSIEVTLGDGIFTLDGEGWKHSRAMLRPQFAREQVAHVQLLEPHVQALASRIRQANGGKFDLQPLFFEFTIDSATEFLFGETCGSLSDGLEDGNKSAFHSELDSETRKKFASAFNYSQFMLFVRLNFQDFHFLGDSPKFRRCNKIVHAFTDFYVKKALSASDEELAKFSRNGYIFLYELAKQTRDPKVLRDQCLNVLLAGRDTTAGLLSFVFFELARNPQVLARLRQEINNSFDPEDLSVLTFESLKKCEYLKWVINETLRMYPSVPANFRLVQKNTTLPRGGGKSGQDPIFVPKGTQMAYSVYSTHRLPYYYGEDAEVFRPERWGEPLAKKLGWAFLPFNGGPRVCLGQQFALTEASYVTVRLLQMFDHLDSFDTEYPPPKLTHLTMSLSNGCNVAMY